MPGNEEKYITPKLILDMNMSNEKKQYYHGIHKKMPPLPKSSLNITGFKLERDQFGNIKIETFIRSTLPKAVNVNEFQLLLLDKKNNVIAKKVENFEKLGELLPNTSRLWEINFPRNKISEYETKDLEQWTIAFSENMPHSLDLSDLDASKISSETKNFLKKVINHQNLNTNELVFTGLSVKQNSEKGISVTLLISNGTSEDLEIKQLPLKLYDAKFKLVAKGTFKMKDLLIHAHTSKPISIIFSSDSILNKKADLTKWTLKHHH